jgi:DHA1 family chloramphenicol resistance protein-like MFS transporter
MPRDRGRAPGTGVRAELRSLTRGPLLAAYGVNALVQGATFCTFTYLAPLLTDVTGFGEGRVPAMLMLFGTGAFVGVTAGGRIADAGPPAVLPAGMAALAAGWALLAWTAGNAAAAVVLVFVLGMLAFGIGPALMARVFRLADGAPTLAGGFTTAAFNVGATAGPWLGGLAIDAGLGLRAPVGVSALMMLAALGSFGLAAAVNPAVRRERLTRGRSAEPGTDDGRGRPRQRQR